MKFKILTFLIAVVVCIGVAGARNVGDLFAAAPQSVFPLLAQSTRLDMLDYSRFGSDKASLDALHTPCRVTAETPQTLSVAVGDRVEIQLAMLTSGSDTVVAVVTTVMTPAANSTIDFYDASWQPLKKRLLEMPESSEWIIGGEDISDTLPFITARAAFSPDASTLTITPTADQYLMPADFDRLKTHIAPAMVYNVAGTKLKLRK